MPSWMRLRRKRRTGRPSPEVLRRERQAASWERLKEQVQTKYEKGN